MWDGSFITHLGVGHSERYTVHVVVGWPSFMNIYNAARVTDIVYVTFVFLFMYQGHRSVDSYNTVIW